jgi:hypothetical protein
MVACEKKYACAIAAESPDALSELALRGLAGVTAPVGVTAEKD